MLENIFIITLVIFSYITFGFLLSIILKRNDIADVMWGIGIFLAVLASYFLSDFTYTLTLIIIMFWALRIFTHIGIRFLNKKEEDFRYKVWRENWKYFYTRSFFQVFLLQGFLMLLVASSVIYFKLENLNISNYAYYIFSILAVLFLIYEAVADLQLKKFILLEKKRLNKGGDAKNNILTTGLWKYSRHPNYFGEVSFWWCIFLSLVFPNTHIISYFSNNIFNYLFLLISPLTITYLILYVSGIPMLEKKYIGNKDFERYKSTTPAFFPNFLL